MIAYLGGKTRMLKKIIPVIDGVREKFGNGDYIEPFVGGGSVVCAVNKELGNVFASDANCYLISMYKDIQNGWVPPKHVTEDLYKSIKENPEMYKKSEVAFAGFCCSFASKWFGGYARNKQGTNYALRASNLIVKRRSRLDGVEFTSCGYEEIHIKSGDVIYCDPPYKGTAGYTGVGGFDHQSFYEWVGYCVEKGAIVIVSEYDMPSDSFVCISELSRNVGLSNQGDIKKKNSHGENICAQRYPRRNCTLY